MKLVIVESPTKAKTLKRFLGKGYAVEASMGHVRDLPKSKLGVDVKRKFEPEYETVKGRGTTVAKLRKLAKEADEIYLAMDPDREGEAIAYHVAWLLSRDKKKAEKGRVAERFKRVTFHEITKPAIEAAMKEPGEIKMDLVDAQQARRVLDRLVGYNLSPVLWKKVRRGLSAGRVQSVALRLITQREREIEAFKAQEYWTIATRLSQNQDSRIKIQDFAAELFERDGERLVVRGSLEDKGKGVFYIDDKKKADVVVGDLKKALYVVKSVERKERKRQPYPPYTTSTLQQAAANVLGWSGKQTMRIAQQLYEAGLITYHRTDSLNLSSQAVAAARELIEKEYGANYLPEKPKFYKTKSKSAQEAHEAIRPTDVTQLSAEGVNGKVTERHQKLYRLIRNRFLACQMVASVYDQTTIITEAKVGKTVYGLKTTGSILKFEGWMVLNKSKIHANGPAGKNQKSKIQSENQNSVEEEMMLPEVTEGEEVKCLGVEAEKKETLPPPRYNDASLVKELEKRGIGRPSTYAPIISVLIDRAYVERVEKRFYPTSVGMTVVDFLTKHFTQVMDYDFTAQLEDDLDKVASEKKDWRKLMADFWEPFEKRVEKSEGADRVKIPVEKTGKKCPECKEGELVVRTGRFGKFLSCSRFPECKYTAPLVEKLDGFKCPECKSDVVLKRTRKGRTFWGCSGYPKCKWASWKDPRKEVVSKK